MLSPELRQQYFSPSEAESAIRKVIDTHMENGPPRVFNAYTGRLCDREAQIHSFKTSAEYKKLLSSTMMQEDLRIKRIRDVVSTYFRFVMLSHKWEDKEPLLADIQDKIVYELDPAGGIAKLQSFCE